MISYEASKYSPGTTPSLVPIIVNVLPLPVCPYAKHVVFAPLNVSETSGSTHS